MTKIKLIGVQAVLNNNTLNFTSEVIKNVEGDVIVFRPAYNETQNIVTGSRNNININGSVYGVVCHKGGTINQVINSDKNGTTIVTYGSGNNFENSFKNIKNSKITINGKTIVDNTVSSSKSNAKSEFSLENKSGKYEIELTNSSTLQMRSVIAESVDTKCSNNSKIEVRKCNIGTLHLKILNNSTITVNNSVIDTIRGELSNNSRLTGKDNNIRRHKINTTNNSEDNLD